MPSPEIDRVINAMAADKMRKRLNLSPRSEAKSIITNLLREGKQQALQGEAIAGSAQSLAHVAAIHNRRDIVKLLTREGIWDAEQRDISGRTPGDWLAVHKQEDPKPNKSHPDIPEIRVTAAAGSSVKATGFIAAVDWLDRQITQKQDKAVAKDGFKHKPIDYAAILKEGFKDGYLQEKDFDAILGLALKKNDKDFIASVIKQGEENKFLNDKHIGQLLDHAIKGLSQEQGNNDLLMAMKDMSLLNKDALLGKINDCLQKGNAAGMKAILVVAAGDKPILNRDDIKAIRIPKSHSSNNAAIEFVKSCQERETSFMKEHYPEQKAVSKRSFNPFGRK